MMESVTSSFNSKMGDRVQRTKPPPIGRPTDKTRDNVPWVLSTLSAETSVLSQDIDVIPGIMYTPQTTATRQTYEYILNAIQLALGDHPHTVLRGCADEILTVLKSSELSESIQREHLTTLLGPVTSEHLTVIVNLGAQNHGLVWSSRQYGHGRHV
jgi:hypothetical protein